MQIILNKVQAMKAVDVARNFRGKRLGTQSPAGRFFVCGVRSRAADDNRPGLVVPG